VAAHAQARLVASEADDAGTRAQRGGDSALGARDLAGSKKNAARRRATIVFLDESGFSERPAVRCTWAPRGQTPVLIHRQRCWKRLSAIGALAYRPARRDREADAHLYLGLHPDVVRSAEVIRFLRHLRRHIRGPIVLLWDGLNAHRGQETTRYLRSQRGQLRAHRLPAYAPELNPVEGLWAWIKGTTVPNLCADGLDSLRQHVCRGRRRAGRRRHLLLGFLRKAGLSL
jgi:transposase